MNFLLLLLRACCFPPGIIVHRKVRDHRLMLLLRGALQAQLQEMRRAHHHPELPQGLLQVLRKTAKGRGRTEFFWFFRFKIRDLPRDWTGFLRDWKNLLSRHFHPLGSKSIRIHGGWGSWSATGFPLPRN